MARGRGAMRAWGGAHLSAVSTAVWLEKTLEPWGPSCWMKKTIASPRCRTIDSGNQNVAIATVSEGPVRGGGATWRRRL